MYTRYFGFDMAPFSIAPDPRFLYLGSSHREAMAHLLYGVRQGGLVVLTGEVGTGKTTVCRCLLQQLPDHVDVAYLINPRQTAAELLQSVLAELGLDLGGSGVTSTKVLVDLLNERLLEGHAQGRDTLLIIDEAQNLSPEVLEQLRLLTNLETTERKLLQLILLGQPELNALLASPELRQLAQRVTARHHLQALSRADVGEYIAHRLRIAGCDHPLFTAAAIRHIARRSGGMPRLINLICDRSLLGVYAESGHQVSRALCRRAATEALPPAVRRPVAGPGLAVAGGLAALAAAALLGWQAAGIEPQVERLPAAGADVATPGPSLHQGLEQLARPSHLADPPSCPGPATADRWRGGGQRRPPRPGWRGRRRASSPRSSAPRRRERTWRHPGPACTRAWSSWPATGSWRTRRAVPAPSPLTCGVWSWRRTGSSPGCKPVCPWWWSRPERAAFTSSYPASRWPIPRCGPGC